MRQQETPLALAISFGLHLFLHNEGAHVVIVTSNRQKEAIEALSNSWKLVGLHLPALGGRFTFNQNAGVLSSNRSDNWRCFVRSYRPGNEESLAGFCGDNLIFVVYGWEGLSVTAQNIIQASVIQPAGQIIKL